MTALAEALHAEWIALAAWLSLEQGLCLGEARDAAYTLLPSMMDYAADWDATVANVGRAAQCRCVSVATEQAVYLAADRCKEMVPNN